MATVEETNKLAIVILAVRLQKRYFWAKLVADNMPVVEEITQSNVCATEGVDKGRNSCENFPKPDVVGSESTELSVAESMPELIKDPGMLLDSLHWWIRERDTRRALPSTAL